MPDTKVSGFSVNGVISQADIVNGFEITGITHKHDSFNGWMAGSGNKVTARKDLQTGLINRIGKRIIPFVNVRLKKAVKTAG